VEDWKGIQLLKLRRIFRKQFVGMGGPGTHIIIGLHISDAKSLGSISRFI
jgi:hypothetical protein